MKKSFVLGAVLSLGFVACSEAGDPITPQFDLCMEACVIDRGGVVALPGTINLGSTLAVGFVVDGRIAAANSVRGAQFFLTTMSESDTIPGPLPPGPIESLLRSVEGQAFIKTLFAMADDDGGPLPSDTIPGPGPIGRNVIVWDFNSDGVQDMLVLASADYLKNTKRLSAATTAFQLSMKNGKTANLGGPIPVSISTEVPIGSH